MVVGKYSSKQTIKNDDAFVKKRYEFLIILNCSILHKLTAMSKSMFATLFFFCLDFTNNLVQIV